MNLLPCPHCGGTAELLIYGGGSYIIGCDKCRAHSGFYRSEAEAAVGWSKRVSPWRSIATEEPPKDKPFLFQRTITDVPLVAYWEETIPGWLGTGGEPVHMEPESRWMPIPLEASA